MPYACHDAHKTRHSLCCEPAPQFTERPTRVHRVAVKCILRYLHGTKDCGIMYPTSIFCGNQSAVRLVKNPEFHRRTKHIDLQ